VGNSTDIVISNDQSNIIVKQDSLELYGNTDAAALASKVDQYFQTIQIWANAHQHTGVTTGSGTSSTTAVTLGPPSAVGSLKVKMI
jgi:hypothetical protein